MKKKVKVLVITLIAIIGMFAAFNANAEEADAASVNVTIKVGTWNTGGQNISSMAIGMVPASSGYTGWQNGSSRTFKAPSGRTAQVTAVVQCGWFKQYRIVKTVWINSWDQTIWI